MNEKYFKEELVKIKNLSIGCYRVVGDEQAMIYVKIQDDLGCFFNPSKFLKPLKGQIHLEKEGDFSLEP